MRLQLDHVDKHYGGTPVLRDLCLDLPRGLHLLVGGQGAGKSTLARILATVEPPDAGRLLLDGVDLVERRQAARARIGYLPPDLALYPTVDAERLLAHFAVLQGLARRGERREAAEQALREVGLWERRRQALGSMTPAERLRFGLAVARLRRPDLLVLDPAMEALDRRERALLLELLRGFARTGIVLLALRRADDLDGRHARTVRLQCGRARVQPHSAPPRTDAA